MRIPLLLPLFLLAGSFVHQQPVTRQSVSPDPVTLLTQSVARARGSEGLAAFDAIHGFVGAGTITYFCPSQEESGSVTVRGRGSDQFRMDAQLSEGLRSIVVDRGRGSLKEVSGPISELPFLNAVNMGNLVLPYPVIAGALADPRTLISYVGMVDVSGHATHQVHVRRKYPSSEYPKQSDLAATTDYFIDAHTGLVLRVADTTYPNDPSSQNYTHEIDLGDYRNMNGLFVPMRITEMYMGTPVWELQLSAVTFNTGLSDSDFIVK